MRIEVVNLDELCAEVNRLLLVRGISVADGRTASVVTPRNVRYYRTIGLLKPPTRLDGRAEYEQSHINEIIAVKQAQHDGVTLEQLLEQRNETETEEIDISLMLNHSFNSFSKTPPTLNFLVTKAEALELNVDSSESHAVFGWSIFIGTNTLSGSGSRPTQQQIDAIRKILD